MFTNSEEYIPTWILNTGHQHFLKNPSLSRDPVTVVTSHWDATCDGLTGVIRKIQVVRDFSRCRVINLPTCRRNFSKYLQVDPAYHPVRPLSSSCFDTASISLFNSRKQRALYFHTHNRALNTPTSENPITEKKPEPVQSSIHLQNPLL